MEHLWHKNSHKNEEENICGKTKMKIFTKKKDCA